jgi:hypothetical protein
MKCRSLMTNVRKISVMFMVLATVTIMAVGSSQVSFAAGENTKVRAFQGGLQISEEDSGNIGVDTDCVGGIESADVVKMICYLIPPGVSNDDNSNAIATLESSTSIACPADVGFSGDHTCFSVTFAGALFDEGTVDNPADWHFHAEFYNAADEIIADGRQEFQNLSFLVIPESPIGIAALLLSSLAALGGFMYLRGRKNQSMLNI